jgi:hypothetical protein
MNFPTTHLPLVSLKHGMSLGEIIAIVLAIMSVIAFLAMVYKCATTSPTPSYCFRG